MLPNAYADQYLKLKVALGKDGEATVEVKDYQNPGANFFVKYDEGILDNLGKLVVNDLGRYGKHWSKVIGVYDAHTPKGSIFSVPFPANFHDKIQLVHKGAGSPQQIAAVLQLAWMYPKEMGLSSIGS